MSKSKIAWLLIVARKLIVLYYELFWDHYCWHKHDETNMFVLLVGSLWQKIMQLMKCGDKSPLGVSFKMSAVLNGKKPNIGAYNCHKLTLFHLNIHFIGDRSSQIAYSSLKCLTSKMTTRWFRPQNGCCCINLSFQTSTDVMNISKQTVFNILEH